MLALGAVAIGAGIAVWATLWLSLRTSAVIVPDVRGQAPAHAAAVLQQDGLVARIQDGIYDPGVLPGQIASQRPPAGFQLKRGAVVLLHPSLGKASQKVPNLVGLPETVAETELESADLVEGPRCEVSEATGAMAIIAQQPPAGALVSPKTQVALLVNAAPARRRYVMPDFVGIREDLATRTLSSLGFRLATLQRVRYQGMAPGLVLRQDPPAGSPVLDASVVGLWVSE